MPVPEFITRYSTALRDFLLEKCKFHALDGMGKCLPGRLIIQADFRTILPCCGLKRLELYSLEIRRRDFCVLQNRIDTVSVLLRPKESNPNTFRQVLALQDVVILQHRHRTTILELDQELNLGKCFILFSEQFLINVIPSHTRWHLPHITCVVCESQWAKKRMGQIKSQATLSNLYGLFCANVPGEENEKELKYIK
jgi:hypothetical protein